MDPLALLQRYVAIPGPPGQEDAVRDALAEDVQALGLKGEVDAKGNFAVRLGEGPPKVVVTAHMDEIALVVKAIYQDGSLAVTNLGGIYPWKLGEGPVTVMAPNGWFEGVFSMGSVHTESESAATSKARTEALTWEMGSVKTGMGVQEVLGMGVKPGTRVVVSPTRRILTAVGDLVAGYFLDDRADLVSWILALAELKQSGIPCHFVATSSEEVGGEGALFYLHRHRADAVIALELAPNVPDAPIQVNANPVLWVGDSYSHIAVADIELAALAARDKDLFIQFQLLSRGGSDASCAASHGLCARPFTLGLPMENSHGYEMAHPDSMANLAAWTTALVGYLA